MILAVEKAQEIICAAGLRLLKEGLAERTWGNISQRLDSEHFAITPSGKQYAELTVSDIVTVSINDLSYDGHIKPSSEKELHAVIYAARNDVNAIIHTHQLYASIVSVLKINNMGEDINAGIARRAPSGSNALALNCVKVLGNKRSVLLANHGAVCVGDSIIQAFTEAMQLEERCRNFINKCMKEKQLKNKMVQYERNI